jgi:putative SOS response-associated peptidase YedK
MCARFTLRRPLSLVVKELADTLSVGLFDFDPPPRYNIAPTQLLAAFRTTPDAGRSELVPLKWGLIPSWSKDPKIGSSLLNARAETVAEKPAFRAAFKRRRCLILADGYYEWTGKPGKKQPWHFHYGDDRPFAFAGLWEHWKPSEGEPVESCTIVTTAANEFAAKYHDRMPVIINPTDYGRWLDPAADTTSLLPLLDTRPVDGIEVAAANPAVNNPRHEAPDCIVAPRPGDPVPWPRNASSS